MRQFIREGEFIGELTVHQDGVDLVDGGVDGLHQDGHVLQPLGGQDVVPARLRASPASAASRPSSGGRVLQAARRRGVLAGGSAGKVAGPAGSARCRQAGGAAADRTSGGRPNPYARTG